MTGQIEAEKLQGELCKVKKSYIHENAKMDGLSEGEKLSEFFGSLGDAWTADQKLDIWKMQQNMEHEKFKIQQHTDRMKCLAEKVKNIVLTKDEIEYGTANPVITTDGSSAPQIHLAQSTQLRK